MTTEIAIRNILSALDKYWLYADTLSQYNKLDKEDKVIIAPYISRLKQTWESELNFLKNELCMIRHEKVVS